MECGIIKRRDMTSIKLKFRPSALSDGGEGTLFFQVTRFRVTRTICTDFHIRQDEWNDKHSIVRITGDPERQERLRLISSQVEWSLKQLMMLVMEREKAEMDYSADDIVMAYRRLPALPTWFGFIRDMIAVKCRAGRYGTAKTYRDALNSFACFRGGQDMALDALDADTVGLYEAWMKGRGLKRNSTSCYLRTLRTLYRRAVEKGLATDKDIFRHVFTGFAKTPKRAIPLSSVRSIRRLDLPDGSPRAFARDLFLLSLYLQGMSFVDLAYLRKSDIRNGCLRYDRKKTRQTLDIAWGAPMQAIVDKYAHRASGPYLLPIITRQDGTERHQYERVEHNVNRNLKKIGEMAGLHVPLTTYVARHTWASMMRDMGCDLSTVSAGLGHESLKTTQVYLSAIETAAVMQANKKMIGRIMK